MAAMTQNMKSSAMGSAAVAVFGDGAKIGGDSLGDLDRMRAAMVPDATSPGRMIQSPEELAELIFAKYGRYHDATILRNSGQVAFNIYGPSLGLRSFPYTEEQYMEKLNVVVAMLLDFDQAWYVKDFLLSPIAPRNGLPSTPRYDTAVTLRLNLSPTWNEVDQSLVEEWFSAQGSF